MKMLYVTTIARERFGGFIRSSIQAAKNVGIEYHVVANESGVDQVVKDEECERIKVHHHHIDIQRSPFAFIKNKKAYHQLLKLMNEEHFDMIHCNTPMGGVLGRLAARKAGIKEIIYQVHGFHFWKGAPLKNWLLYYPIEKILAHYTDLLITINQEDYAFAQKKLKAKEIIYIPGVGVDTSRFTSISAERKAQLRKEFGIPDDAVVMLSVGELNKNKNHQLAIKALGKLKRQDIYYVICGEGELQAKLQELADERGVGARLKLVGFRSDVQDFYGMADLFVFTSFREGIPAVVMEAMSSRIPVVASRIRGVVDMLPGSKLLFDPQNEDDLAQRITLAREDESLKQKEIERNAGNLKPFLFESVVVQYEKVYRDSLTGLSS